MTLSGGNMSPVYRVGSTVRRTSGPWTASVHRLLDHARAAGVRGIPKPFGIDESGREVLEFIEGDVANYPMPAEVWNESVLSDTTRLLREIHDASASFSLAGTEWRQPAREPAETVLHNDFAPYNLVFREGSLVGVIDWDWASPGPRVWDLAYLAYRLVPLCSEDSPELDVSRRVDLLLESYGWPISRDELFAMVVERLEALAIFSEKHAILLGNPELTAHAALYRRDAATLASRS